MFVSKAVQISGNLNYQPLVYKLCPTNELSEGSWHIAIGAVSFESNETLNSLCTLSCNLVQSQKFSDSNQVVTYKEPLVSFIIKTVASPSGSRGIYRFGIKHLKVTITFIEQYIICHLIFSTEEEIFDS